MIIKQAKQYHNWRSLDLVSVGNTVVFRSTFHQDVCPDDPFLVLSLSGSYRDQPQCTRDKIAVVNLRNNKLSFVAPERDVRIVKATVCLEDQA